MSNSRIINFFFFYFPVQHMVLFRLCLTWTHTMTLENTSYFRPTHGTEFVFTSWLGKQMDSSSVTAALTEELAHGGCTKRYFCIKLQFFNMHHFMLAFLLPQDQFKIWCFCHPQSDHDHAQAHSSHPCVRGPGRRG